MNNTKYIKVYTADRGNEESDSLHLAYAGSAEGGLEHWFSLNGNNGILFPAGGSKRMSRPRVIKSESGIYKVMARDALDDTKIYAYMTKDFIDYGAEMICERSECAEYETAGDTAAISDEILSKLCQKWGRPEPVFIEHIENPDITISRDEAYTPAGYLPDRVNVTYSNGNVEARSVKWDLSGLEREPERDADNPGSYIVRGYVTEHIYDNPFIYHRADPFIYRHADGDYYFTASHTDMEHNLDGKYQYRYIILRKSSSLDGLSDSSKNFTERIVFDREPLPGGKSPHIWAPEIHYISGKWYIYYTTSVDETDIWSIRPHALCCDGDPMKDEWKNLGPIKKTVEDTIAFTDFSLDHTVFSHKGELYLFWAEKHPTDSVIYAAKMADPVTIDSERICAVVSPEYNWERHGFHVCEGPGFLVRNGKIFMTYSASGTDALYCVGMATADENADLLDPASWTKTPYPVFQSSREASQYGPGHNSFTTDEEGNDIFVYHARQEERYLEDEKYQPLYDAGRNTSLMRLFWKPDGTPDFSTPMMCGRSRDVHYEVMANIRIR